MGQWGVLMSLTSPSMLSRVITALQSFQLPSSWLSTGDLDLSPTSPILVWAFPCFNLVAMSDLHPSTRTGTQQSFLCLPTLRHSGTPLRCPRVIPQRGAKQRGWALWTASLFPCGASQESSKDSGCSDTVIPQMLIPLGHKPRPAPYFTQVVESLPEANEWWSAVSWPSPELTIPRRAAPFIQSPLMPISSSTFTFNQIWLRGQSVSDSADLGWMQVHTESTHLHLVCPFRLYTRYKQSMTC